MNTYLADDTVALRALEPEDLDALYHWENDPDVWSVSDTLTPYSRFALRQYLENAVTNDIFATRELRLMACDSNTGHPIGTVDLFNFNPVHRRAELGLLVSPRFRGRGLAGHMLTLICRYAGEHLSLHQLYAMVPVTNHECITLFTTRGFSESGRLTHWIRTSGQWIDATMLQKVL